MSRCHQAASNTKSTTTTGRRLGSEISSLLRLRAFVTRSIKFRIHRHHRLLCWKRWKLLRHKLLARSGLGSEILLNDLHNNGWMLFSFKPLQKSIIMSENSSSFLFSAYHHQVFFPSLFCWLYIFRTCFPRIYNGSLFSLPLSATELFSFRIPSTKNNINSGERALQNENFSESLSPSSSTLTFNTMTKIDDSTWFDYIFFSLFTIAVLDTQKGCECC